MTKGNVSQGQGVNKPMSSVELFDFQKRILDDTKDRTRVAYYLDMG